MFATIISDFVLISLTAFLLFYEYFKQSRSYWQNRNVLCLDERVSLKNFPAILSNGLRRPEKEIERIYGALKKNDLKHGGAYLFNEPVYVPVTPTFLRKVLEEKSSDLTAEYAELQSKNAKVHGECLRNFSTGQLQKVLQNMDFANKLMGKRRRSDGVKLGTRGVVDAFFKEFEGKLEREYDSNFHKIGFGKIPETIRNCLEELVKNKQQYVEKRQISDDHLNAIILETLRIHPVVPFLTKKCVRPLKIPGTDVVLEKGTKILVAVSGIQNDPDNFTDPDYFNPRRFSNENLPNINQHIFWNPYYKNEMEFLKNTLKILIGNDILSAI